MNDYILHTGSGGICHKGYGKEDKQLHSFDYLYCVPGARSDMKYVEVQFKNTRKGFYLNSNDLPLEKGDIVAVESTPGHDIGTVTMTGRLVSLQMKRVNLKNNTDIKRVYRKARAIDMEKYEEAKKKEHDTMIRSRQIAKNLNLEMKIGDVEYQGDGNKAIFYYIADRRVDFRQLIKVLAETFRVRIEMKQIGARQEAGRIGGFGPCGRELCCATWMTNFVSVSTSAARYQDLSINPLKLAGQCAKLKCCLNYEVDSYVEANKNFPARDIVLETQDNSYFFFKADILNRLVTYSTDKIFAANLITISANHSLEIIALNKKGIKPINLKNDNLDTNTTPKSDILDEKGLTRFDKKRKKKRKKKRSNTLQDTEKSNLRSGKKVSEFNNNKQSDNKSSYRVKQRRNEPQKNRKTG
ncbi:MAG TPA: regulatory iron-sulfur-containing complex subunit RicT [Bacteroidaceae bacterium]|nr:regulatory iron-sulfur-containing complex subunit RicT [Bacteroidaceae bacterium]